VDEGPSDVDAAWTSDLARPAPTAESQPFFSVVIAPTLATVGAEVRLILSRAQIAAAHLHCLPT
jgi:hypothetical protein